MYFSFHNFPLYPAKTMPLPLREIVIASSSNGTITCYDIASGNVVARFNGSQSPRKGLAVVGNSLIAASHISSDTIRGFIHLYNWWSSTAVHHIPLTEPVGPLVASSDGGSYLFAGGISGRVHVVSLPSGDIVRSFLAHSKPVSCLSLNSDGSLLFSGGDDGNIGVFPVFRLIDIDESFCKPSQLLMHRFIGHDCTVTSITTGIGTSNCTIISCSLDCTCKFWSLLSGTQIMTISFPCTIWGVEMDPTESQFFAAASDGSIYNGPLKKPSRHKRGLRLSTLSENHGGPVIALAVMNWGRNLVTASETGSIWLWDVSGKHVVRVLGEEIGGVSELIVAGGLWDCGGSGSRGGEVDDVGRWGLGLGFSAREWSKPVKEAMETERMLGVLTHDRDRAIDTLGSAIGSYEKLLELILKEAEKGNNCGNNRVKDVL